ncbi:hypothetical protein L2E82_30693 [Cichorium intybus]|uniref:Uncharacterized protein n=1 Tax=Cichorium intybus TaxID=13427 RepID=A0ACB9D130_CICIN|nr:hypothetical protein L2E82_30693 [Cichorium intybus]
MTRSSNSPLTPQFQEPEQEFRRRRRHARLMADIANLSWEEYASRTQEETGQGLVHPTIPDGTHFEIKGQFLHLLRETLFTGKDAEDANQHVESVLEIADYFHIPGVTKDAVMLRGPIPKKTPADGYALIEELAQHSHQWHSSRDSSLRKKPTDEQDDGLAALNAKLDALGGDMKKVNQTIHAIQVGCDNCSGPHLARDCPLDEDGKRKESVCYSSGDRFDERRPRNNNWKPYEEYKKDQAKKYKQNLQKLQTKDTEQPKN